MAGVRIKSLQAATPLLEEQFDRMLFVVDLAQPDTTLCLTGAELKAAVGLKEHTHPLEDVDGLVGELEKKLDKEGGTISGDLVVRGETRLRNLVIEEYLSTPELRYNRITATGNELWATDAAIIDDAWQDADGIWLVTLKAKEGETTLNFQYKDILRGVFNNGTSVQTAFFEVTGVVDETRFDCIALGDVPPQRFMTLVRQGNKTNADRQGSVYIDGLNKYLRVLDGVSSEEIDLRHIKVQLGDLSKIDHPLFGQLSGFGALLENAYISGRLVQHNPDTGEDFIIGAVAIQGDQVFHYDSDLVVDKETTLLSATEQGISSSEGTRCWQYKSGSDWVTIEGETGLTLSVAHNAAFWGDRRTLTIRYLVEGTYFDIITITKLYDGEDAYRVEVSSDSGSSFINGDITTTLTARVYKGSREVTSTIAPALFSWMRHSANPDGDSVWNALHEGAGPTISIGDEDVFRKAVFECIVTIN